MGKYKPIKLGDNLVKSNVESPCVIEDEVSQGDLGIIKGGTPIEIEGGEVTETEIELVTVPKKVLAYIWKKCITKGVQDLTGYGAIRWFGMELFRLLFTHHDK